MVPLAHIIEHAATLHGRRPAVSHGSRRLTYGEATQRAARLAGALQARGLAPGDRVALLARNSFRYLELNLACAYAGIVLIPLNVRLAAKEIDRILAVTQTRLLFQALPHDSQGVAVIAWDDTDAPGAVNAYEQLVDGSPPLGRPVAAKPDDIAQIFFTSGTTGEPKGACLTHQNLVATALDTIVSMELTADDVWFHAPPMFHLVDAVAIWAITLLGGRHVAEHFDPVRFAQVVESERVTQVSMPPTLLDMIVRTTPLARYDLRSLNRISFGGSPMPEPVYRRCKAFGCPLVQSYGATEASGAICQQYPRDLTRFGGAWRNSVGQPVPLMRLRIVDDRGDDRSAGEIGEIVVAGPRIMAGYWRNPAATQAAIPDGWYRTGDLGRADEEGHVAIVGRKKDMIISGGENVYPTEVENALLEHPSVAEAAVFGVPSERWGEEVRAVVYLDPGVAASSEELPKELIEHCRRLIGGYKVPKVIEVTGEPLPKSGPGKIAKNVLRAPHWKQVPT